MKQSDRIRYCKEYGRNCYTNPLRKDYQKRKKEISKKARPLWVRIPRIMIFGYFGLFMISWLSIILLPLEIADICSIVFWVTIILGILNLVVCFCGWAYKPEGDFADKLENLCEEYAKKGFIEEQELFEHECCEYDDYKEAFVCCVTKQPLSSQEYLFCRHPGNCKQCRTFVSAYLGADAVEWWGESHEYKR